DIVVQVGRTGVLTPRAVLEPVHLAGTTVQSATLHNQDYITTKDIRVGDTVLVQKAGEIIPEVLEVDISKRPQEAEPYLLPNACPICGAMVARDEHGASLRCTGAECPAQLLRNLTHFASRDAMDIDGLGPAILQQLIESGLVQNSADLYDLREQEIAQLERLGEKSASNLIAAIQKSKGNDLSCLLYALGIRQVGVKAAKVLASHFRSLEAVRAASTEELQEVGDIGGITAQFIADFFESAQAQDLLLRLEKAGVNLVSNAKLVDERFLGMTFVLTGSLALFGRKEATELIEARGGKAASAVSKRTTYVVAGEAAGSKLKRALELEIPILTEEEFKKMLE
ncbi:MAG: NAD-dependent DNA ligase LigA, partial [Ruthenibacterium sp.]